MGRQEQSFLGMLRDLVSGSECWRAGAGEGVLLLFVFFLVSPHAGILFDHLMS